MKNRALRNGLGFLAAVLVAPAALSVTFDLTLGPRDSVDLANLAKGVVLFEFVGFVPSLVLGVAFGLPTIAVARACNRGAAWLYAVGGLLAGLAIEWLFFAPAPGGRALQETFAFCLTGVLAALTYWLIAGRHEDKM